MVHENNEHWLRAFKANIKISEKPKEKVFGRKALDLLVRQVCLFECHLQNDREFFSRA